MLSRVTSIIELIVLDELLMRYAKQFPWGRSMLEASTTLRVSTLSTLRTSKEGGRGGEGVMGHNKLSLTEETRVNLDDTQVYRSFRRRLIGFSCNEINLWRGLENQARPSRASLGYLPRKVQSLQSFLFKLFKSGSLSKCTRWLFVIRVNIKGTF